MLKAIAQGLVPGIPSNLRVLLLGQTSLEGLDIEVVTSDQNGSRNGESVLEHVLRSDKVRERYLKEAEGMRPPYYFRELEDNVQTR